MILADSSVWIDHLRKSDAHMVACLAQDRICSHPHIVGELALGSIRGRTVFLDMLAKLPSSVLASHGEVLSLVEQLQLYARGIGYTDAHLLASCLLSPGTLLWTKDRRLDDIARELNIAAEIS